MSILIVRIIFIRTGIRIRIGICIGIFIRVRSANVSNRIRNTVVSFVCFRKKIVKIVS
jgi:hypothetical protein